MTCAYALPKGRAGKEATDVADWIGYLPEHDDDNKDALPAVPPGDRHQR